MPSNQLSPSAHSLPSSKPLVRSGAMLLACCSLFLALTGCHGSADQIGSNVKDSMQTTFDKDPNYVNYHFKVDKVAATKKDDTHYEGIATVEYQGQPHQVPVHITLDGNGGADWKTDPDGLSFAAQ